MQIKAHCQHPYMPPALAAIASHSQGLQCTRVKASPKLQALVYDTLPPTTSSHLQCCGQCSKNRHHHTHSAVASVTKTTSSHSQCCGQCNKNDIVTLSVVASVTKTTSSHPKCCGQCNKKRHRHTHNVTANVTKTDITLTVLLPM